MCVALPLSLSLTLYYCTSVLYCFTGCRARRLRQHHVHCFQCCVHALAYTHVRVCGVEVIGYNTFAFDGNVKECVLHTYLSLTLRSGVCVSLTQLGLSLAGLCWDTGVRRVLGFLLHQLPFFRLSWPMWSAGEHCEADS